MYTHCTLCTRTILIHNPFDAELFKHGKIEKHLSKKPLPQKYLPREWWDRRHEEHKSKHGDDGICLVGITNDYPYRPSFCTIISTTLFLIFHNNNSHERRTPPDPYRGTPHRGLFTYLFGREKHLARPTVRWKSLQGHCCVGNLRGDSVGRAAPCDQQGHLWIRRLLRVPLAGNRCRQDSIRVGQELERGTLAEVSGRRRERCQVRK